VASFGLPKIDLRHDAGDRLAMSGDENGLAALDRVEQAGQTRLGFGGLDFAHKDPQLDQSDRLV
jgi:hypothetical protein